jgi:hypothetical protein
MHLSVRHNLYNRDFYDPVLTDVSARGFKVKDGERTLEVKFHKELFQQAR